MRRTFVVGYSITAKIFYGLQLDITHQEYWELEEKGLAYGPVVEITFTGNEDNLTHYATIKETYYILSSGKYELGDTYNLNHLVAATDPEYNNILAQYAHNNNIKTIGTPAWFAGGWGS